MALTDEEKQKIIEEECLRAEERAKYSQPSQKKNKGISTGAGCLIILVAMVAIPWVLSSTGVGKSESKPSGTVLAPAVDAEAVKAKQEIIGKIELLNPRIEKNIIDSEELHLTVKNNTGRDVDGIRFMASFKNNFDEVVTDWNGKKTFYTGYQGVIKSGASEPISQQLVTWYSPTKVADITVIQVHFVDGETIELE